MTYAQKTMQKYDILAKPPIFWTKNHVLALLL